MEPDPQAGSGVCSVAVVGFGRVIQACSTNQERHNGNHIHPLTSAEDRPLYPSLAWDKVTNGTSRSCRCNPVAIPPRCQSGATPRRRAMS